MLIISGPYGSDDVAVKESRKKIISRACVKAIVSGVACVAMSPLIYGLQLVEEADKVGVKLPDSYDYWEKFCLEFISVSDQMYVLNLDGWASSNGVTSEIGKAKELNIPIYLVDSETLEFIKVL